MTAGAGAIVVGVAGKQEVKEEMVVLEVVQEVEEEMVVLEGTNLRQHSGLSTLCKSTLRRRPATNL